MTDPQWRDVPGYEGFYQVTDDAAVRSLDRVVGGRAIKGRILKPTPMYKGHLRVGLSRDGNAKWFFVYHLVLMAFVGPRPDGYIACHRDDDPNNNHLDNLYWGTHTDNMRDALRNGRNHEANKTHCKSGHKFTPENTRISPYNGQRLCVTCCRAWTNASWLRNRPDYVRGPKSTHCASGRHLWSEQEPYIKSTGGREYRPCREEAKLRRTRRRAVA